MEYSQHLCPYLERRDPRCAGVLTMTNLREALGRCAGGQDCCSIYYRIRATEPRREQREPAVCSA